MFAEFVIIRVSVDSILCSKYMVCSVLSGIDSFLHYIFAQHGIHVVTNADNVHRATEKIFQIFLYVDHIENVGSDGSSVFYLPIGKAGLEITAYANIVFLFKLLLEVSKEYQHHSPSSSTASQAWIFSASLQSPCPCHSLIPR